MEIKFLPKVVKVMAGLSLLTAGMPIAEAQVTFDPPKSFKSADGVVTIVSVDFNKDGLLDIATSNRGEDTASVHLNQGAAVFAQPGDRYPVGPFAPLLAGEKPKSRPLAIASGDFNNDGFPDLAVSNSQADSVSILLNRGVLGAGKFRLVGHFTVRTDGAIIRTDGAMSIPGSLNTLPLLEPGALVVADLNNDGRLDIATTNLAGRNVSVLRGNGDGTFGLPSLSFVGQHPISIVAGDWNLDGSIDLAVANNAPEGVPIVEGSSIFIPRYTVSVLRNNNNATATFAPEVRHQVGPNPMQIIAADLNKDTLPDLLIANHAVSGAPAPIRSWVSVLRNNVGGSFSPEVQIATDQAPNSVAVADMNNDGMLDIVTVHDYTPGSFAISTQNLNGVFTPFVTYSAGVVNAPNYVNAADYDRDGDIDLLSSSKASDLFALLLNQVVANAPPPVTAPTPTTGTDLTVAFGGIKWSHSPSENTSALEFSALVSNSGSVPVIAGATDVKAYLNGTLIGTWFLSTGVQQGLPISLKFKNRSLTGLLLNQPLRIVVDSGNTVIETNESNNSAQTILQ